MAGSADLLQERTSDVHVCCPFSTRPRPVKNETSSRCAYRRRGQDPSRTARAVLCLASTSTRSASGCWRVMGIAFQVDQLVAATRSSGADGLADQWPSARELPGLIPPVGQRCVVSLPDTTVAAPSTAGIGHGRRRSQPETSLAEQGFDRANECLRVGEVVHGQGKRIGTGVRVGHHGCGWIWGG